ncbi:3-oxoadipate CoA-transferase subunit B (EC [Olavius algarvensis associated proteobacterium Delta 3]|nr:3-oxoadipate CoA-transferase subunit B (EC [Olavius algarvensis associated proteobacterium Delta 3]CAB5122904.1 3-oxoadipate CoA-transferase subunit B (EC [Olavius algarvensis associated proteobacterium Delta 3]
MTAYTAAELMVTAAARKIRNGEIVFVGMRLPLLGFLLAKCTHAPRAVGVYELGIVRDNPSPRPILTMGDLPNLYQAAWLADTGDAMALLQQGAVDISFIGGAQIDRYGNLNTTVIRSSNGIRTRLPGSGGACDLACLAGRHMIIMAHEKRRFVARVDYVTSPGFGRGSGWRQQRGLPRGGPAGVITTLGCFSFDPQTREMVLDSVHPDVDLETIQAHTGWPVAVSDRLETTPAPTDEELAILRRFDPDGYWTGPRRTENA